MSGFGTDKSTSEKMSKPGFPCTSEDDPKTRGSTIYLQAYEVPYVPRRMSVEEHEESLWFQSLIKRERNPDGPNSSKALFESAKSSSSPWIRLAQSEMSRGLL